MTNAKMLMLLMLMSVHSPRLKRHPKYQYTISINSPQTLMCMSWHSDIITCNCLTSQTAAVYFFWRCVSVQSTVTGDTLYMCLEITWSCNHYSAYGWQLSPSIPLVIGWTSHGLTERWSYTIGRCSFKINAVGPL